jgi:putative ABC transport system ATP-binding protein
MDAVIQACNVTKGFAAGSTWQPVLRGLDVTVARGETVFLVGRSGSGKTTLLSILGSLLTPDGGEVHLLGEDVSRWTAEQRTLFRGRQVGFVFQNCNLFPTLSALDNIVLSLTMQGISRRLAVARAERLLHDVGLGHRLHLRPGVLSTGECQRVAIARALATDAELLFADELTASLDAAAGQNAMRLLTGLVRQQGRTLVVVTHDNRIFPFADRILELEDGRLVQAGAPDRAALDLSIREYSPGAVTR